MQVRLGYPRAGVDPKLEPGVRVAGRYRLERVLGEGGMGVVWAATHELTRKRVALKFVKRADAPGQRARLLREARASCAVRHPHVREVYDIVEDDGGSPVMIMEYLAGQSLADKLDREGRLALPEAAALLLPVVSAVGAAHAVGIIHRDLKPGNIFLAVGPPQTVKVLDFGIAKFTALEGDAAATGALTSSGALLGTPHYMSPEQAFGEKDIDHRTDVWALGLIVYRCLSGVLPTQADNVGQVFKNIVAKPIQPLEQIAPELPADVTALVGRMLSRARADRPLDLREVAGLLAQCTGVTVPDFGAPSRSAAPTEAIDVSATDATATVDPREETEAALDPPAGDRTEPLTPDVALDTTSVVVSTEPMRPATSRGKRAITISAIAIGAIGASAIGVLAVGALAGVLFVERWRVTNVLGLGGADGGAAVQGSAPISAPPEPSTATRAAPSAPAPPASSPVPPPPSAVPRSQKSPSGAPRKLASAAPAASLVASPAPLVASPAPPALEETFK